MNTRFSVALSRIVNEFKLEVIYSPVPPEQLKISTEAVNRPGLQLGGFYGYYDVDRIQIIGKAECAYMEQMAPEERAARIDEFMQHNPPVIIFCNETVPPEEFVEAARKYKIAVLSTHEQTSSFTSALIALLNVELAPRITRHGVLVEVYGEGILLLGDSGVGKSETAIELVKRGHRLIADDAVEIRRVSSKTLVGSSPENIRHFLELRGVGIINVRRLFGMGAVKMTEKIDVVVQLEPWDQKKVYDRMGVDSETTDILGLNVPLLTIPVKPGRNLAIIIEVAAMNNRQKKMGYNAAQELLSSLGVDLSELQGEDIKKDLDI